MNYIKKRTLVLILASVVTVAGSFAETNYKNSVMSLTFQKSSSGGFDMSVHTKNPYNGSLNLIKKSVDTYVLTLPEVNSNAPTPNLSATAGAIKNVEIRTMPYSNNAKGYTRITVKTASPSLQLTTSSKIYLPPPPVEEEKKEINSDKQIVEKTSETKDLIKKEVKETPPVERIVKKSNSQKINNSIKSNVKKSSQVSSSNPKTSSEVNKSATKSSAQPIKKKDDINNYENYDDPIKHHNNLRYMLWTLIVIAFICFFYVNAKHKMKDLIGDSIDINFDDDKPKQKKIKNPPKKEIKQNNPIKIMPKPETYTSVSSQSEFTSDTTITVEEPLNVVDLDELYHQTTSVNEEVETVEEQEENEALEAFLSGFSFDDEENSFGEQEPEGTELTEEQLNDVPEEEGFDNEYFEALLESDNCEFTKDDISCINKLLNSEINNSTLNNIEEFAVSNPIKEPVDKQKVLEDFVTTYAVEQNIVFSENDIKILEKLINFELSADFVTDLKTNPAKTKEMEERYSKSKQDKIKPKRVKILEVRDLLPDLSEALKNQTGSSITSNYKPKDVDYHDNCEVQVFKVDMDLPDLASLAEQPLTYSQKSPCIEDLSDENYEAPKLVIDFDLPDLQDALENPEKYQKVEEEFIPDENALLNNLNNLEFKPFYDDSNDLELKNNNNEKKYDSLLENEYIDLDVKPRAEIKRLKPAAENPIRSASKSKTLTVEKENQIKCIIDNESYTVISTAKITENKGCHLAKKDNMYAVLAFVNDNIKVIKTYSELKSEKIQARLSEIIDEKTNRYLIRIGLCKFMVDVSQNDIKYVMDLC